VKTSPYPVFTMDIGQPFSAESFMASS